MAIFHLEHKRKEFPRLQVYVLSPLSSLDRLSSFYLLFALLIDKCLKLNSGEERRRYIGRRRRKEGRDLQADSSREGRLISRIEHLH